MKRLLLISVLLAFVTVATSANAITVENIAISDTGGAVSVSGKASASGSSEAGADVSSVVRTEGSNTHVRVDISTSADGDARATTSLRTVERTAGEGRFQVREPNAAKTDTAIVAEVSASSTTTSASGFFSAWVNFKVSFIKLYRLLFFWEQ